MRVLFVADGRSPIALNWITHLASAGLEVHLVTTFPCERIAGLASQVVVPVAFSGAARSSTSAGGRQAGGARAINLRAAIRHWAGPLTVPAGAAQLHELLLRVEPDLVHAMRVPYEGMLAAAADPSAPLLVSIWGNDFTLHAPSSPLMRRWTHKTLERADALQTDCQRDLRLAREWGFRPELPSLVVPGNGGIRPSVFHPGPGENARDSEVASLLAAMDPGAPVIVNPRGFRAYVRNDTFFQAAPEILKQQPATVFLCPAMAGEREALAWVERLGITDSVHFLSRLKPEDMAMVYQRAMITLSISEHDGTPNTLLEAMACDCYPIAGDLDSIREWIDDGVNGRLVDPGDPSGLARAVLDSIRDVDSRSAAIRHNREMIARRATQPAVMKEIQAFYAQIVSRGKK